MVAIMPLSSCSRMWQWNTKRPSFGPLKMIITNTRARRQRIGIVQHVPVDGRDEPSIAETLGHGGPRASRAEVCVENDELRLVNMKVVALVAVIDEQPILPRAMGCGQVWSAFHPERGVELRELRGIPVLANGRLPAGIVERNRRDCRCLVFAPFDSTLGQEIGHGDRF